MSNMIDVIENVHDPIVPDPPKFQWMTEEQREEFEEWFYENEEKWENVVNKRDQDMLDVRDEIQYKIIEVDKMKDDMEAKNKELSKVRAALNLACKFILNCPYTVSDIRQCYGKIEPACSAINGTRCWKEHVLSLSQQTEEGEHASENLSTGDFNVVYVGIDYAAPKLSYTKNVVLENGVIVPPGSYRYFACSDGNTRILKYVNEKEIGVTDAIKYNDVQLVNRFDLDLNPIERTTPYFITNVISPFDVVIQMGPLKGKISRYNPNPYKFFILNKHNLICIDDLEEMFRDTIITLLKHQLEVM